MLNQIISKGLGRRPATEHPEFLRNYTGNWVWRAVAAMIDDDCDYLPAYFAERLNAPIQDIVVALEGLEKLGIIRRSANGYKKILKFIYYTDKNLEPNKILSDHVLISTQILSRLAHSRPGQSFYRTSFVGSTEKKFKEFCAKVENLMKEFLIDSSQTPSEKVYALTLSGADLSKEIVSDKSERSPVTKGLA